MKADHDKDMQALTSTNAEISGVIEDKKKVEKELSDVKKELEEEKEKHNKDKEALEAEHKKTIEDIESNHKEEVEELKGEHEEVIKKLHEEIAKLEDKSSSSSSSDSDSDSDSGKDEEIEELRNQVEKERIEKEAKEKEIKELRSQNAVLVSNAKAAAAAAAASEASEGDLMKEVVGCLGEARFCDGDTPVAATKLAKLFEERKLYSGADCSEVVECLRLCSTIQAGGVSLAFYLTQTLIKLITISAGKLGVPSPVSSSSGYTIARKAEEGGKKGSGLLGQLEALVADVFCSGLAVVYSDIEKIAVSAMLESNLEAESNSNNNGNSPRNLIGIISRTLDAVESNHMGKAIKAQVAAQLVWCINGTVFNALVAKERRDAACTCGAGLQLRLAVSVLENYLVRDPATFGAKKRLEHLKEASNVFLMDKSLLTDEALVRDTLPALNFAQIHALLEKFRPDSCSSVPVAAPILSLTKSRAKPSDIVPVDSRSLI